MGLPKIDVGAMTPEERLELMSRIWESFRQAPETLPVTAAQQDEIARRLAEIDAGRMSTRPWAEVREDIRRDPRNKP